MIAVSEQVENSAEHDIEIAKGVLKAMFAKAPSKSMRSPMDFLEVAQRVRELSSKRSKALLATG